jgi:GTP-binding protein
MGRNRTGRSGCDLHVQVPLGTQVTDLDTGERIGELLGAGQELVVARGGVHGLGNSRFKSSTNRTPRQSTDGTPGERRNLRLELKLLADVGLLGLPNAGKSSLIRRISSARPKVADYPFTTLHPNLGVVRVAAGRSFVVADIPGLIEGAADGAGLGTRFLKHLSRTRLLLHVIDIAPPDPDERPAEDVEQVVAELVKYGNGLDLRDRWLVLNKRDLLPAREYEKRREELVRELGWKGPVFGVSALTGTGTDTLVSRLMDYIEEQKDTERRGSTDEEPWDPLS